MRTLTTRRLLAALATTLVMAPTAFADAEMIKPTADASHLATALATSKTNLDLMLSTAPDIGLRDQLLLAVNRGVAIRIIGHFNSQNCAACPSLLKSGVEIRRASLRVDHNIAIVDRGPSSSALMALPGFNKRAQVQPLAQLVRLTTDPAIAAFTDEFDRIWYTARGHRAGPGAENDTAAVFTTGMALSSQNMVPSRVGSRWRWHAVTKSKDNHVTATLVKAIHSAKSSVTLVTSEIHPSALYDALRDALLRDLDVKLVLSGHAYQGPARRGDCRRSLKNPLMTDECLRSRGAEVRYRMNGRMDRKANALVPDMLLIDDQMAWVGSYRSHPRQAYRAFSGMIELRGRTATGLAAAIDTALSATDERATDLAELIQTRKGEGPCRFKPIYANTDDRLAIREAYRGNACLK